MKKKRGAMVQAVCENPPCGKTFQARVADRNRGWAKCCNKSCAAAVRNTERAKQ